jgi:aspartokinase-like uncharacterized kinase
VKVGGSLYDLPDLGPRLRRWLDAHAPRETIVVPGGGAAADVVRALDRTHGLGEEAAHWLALRALRFTAGLLEELLYERGVEIVGGNDDRNWACVWDRGALPILDPYAFCQWDELRPGSLPHTWAVTSDSIAARVAVVAGAAELVLLKSSPPPAGDVAAWAAAGYVDEYLPRVLAGTGVRLRAVDLRGEIPAPA